MKLRMIFALALVTGWTWAQDNGYADLVERIQEAVVNVQTTQVDSSAMERGFNPFDFFRDPSERTPQRDGRAVGTGFFISPDGYIVTNRHVVAGASEIQITTTGDKTFTASVVGTDDSMDVALLKADVRDATFLTMADSDQLRIGDRVLALGYPLQLGFSVTSGLISGIGRNMVTGDVDLATYLQTDADITFGNSGGPLVNVRGEVVGLNTLIVSRGETYGFAIPSNLFKHSVDELRTFGVVRRGALGVQVSDLSEEAKEYYGVDGGALVRSVTAGMPAEAAGLRRDDVILTINGTPVRGSNDVVSMIANMPPDAEVSITYQSRRDQKTTSLRLGNRADLMADSPRRATRNPMSSAEESGLGFSVMPLNAAARRHMGIDEDVQGLLVLDVTDGSLAARKGIATGTLITHINDQPVKSMSDLTNALADEPAEVLVPVRVMDLQAGQGAVEASQRTVFLRKQ